MIIHLIYLIFQTSIKKEIVLNNKEAASIRESVMNP